MLMNEKLLKGPLTHIFEKIISEYYNAQKNSKCNSLNELENVNLYTFIEHSVNYSCLKYCQEVFCEDINTNLM